MPFISVKWKNIIFGTISEAFSCCVTKTTVKMVPAEILKFNLVIQAEFRDNWE